jgi:hypothetical protein
MACLHPCPGWVFSHIIGFRLIPVLLLYVLIVDRLKPALVGAA